jgi:hypothetical protein
MKHIVTSGPCSWKKMSMRRLAMAKVAMPFVAISQTI